MSRPTAALRFCPSCRHTASVSRFDMAVVDRDGVERLLFDLPAAVCATCGWLMLDTEVERRHGIAASQVVHAIESDHVLLDGVRGLDAA